MAKTAERVLSIQSHVVFGYVGGKAAVFPLQCLGYDVDVVNTVNFSNHSGYGKTGGTKATAAELTAMFDLMQHNEILTPRRLLTGYIPGAEALSAVADLAARLKSAKPDIVYLLDPVMGDAGHIYVAPDVVPIYRSMLPLATIITPNWFEAELLTRIQLKDLDSLRRALKSLHEDSHVPNVVISSIPLRPWLLDALPESIRPDESDYLLCITSSVSPESKTPIVHAQVVPTIPGYFSGVGDLFSALVLAHYHPEDKVEGSTPVSLAAAQALTKTHALLEITHEHALSLPEEERLPTDDELDEADPMRKTRRMRGRELLLIQGQDIIRGTKLDERNIRHLLPWDAFWTR